MFFLVQIATTTSMTCARMTARDGAGDLRPEVAS
jgi:hypothetical protein